ncbi:hypothetical protein NEUTE2DRAFT_64300, partial [Neurospora tetrasperma FGSC 2509]
ICIGCLCVNTSPKYYKHPHFSLSCPPKMYFNLPLIPPYCVPPLHLDTIFSFTSYPHLNHKKK